MTRWVYIGMAYGLAGGVLGGYLTYVHSALRRCRRRVEAFSQGSPSRKEDLVEDAA